MARDTRMHAAHRVLAGPHRCSNASTKAVRAKSGARDSTLDRDVAVKVLGPSVDDGFRARFG